jgi:hypothetical protein
MFEFKENQILTTIPLFSRFSNAFERTKCFDFTVVCVSEKTKGVSEQGARRRFGPKR